MSVYDPYHDPNRVPTALNPKKLKDAARARLAEASSGNISIAPQPGTVATAPGTSTGFTAGTSTGSRTSINTAVDSPTGVTIPGAGGRSGGGSHRSGLLTAGVTFATLATLFLGVALPFLIWANELICSYGGGTPMCGQDGVAVRATAVTVVVTVVSLVLLKVAGTLTRQVRNGGGMVLLTFGVGAMAILTAWLRQDLGLPFP